MEIDTPKIMGILNVTPDSFFDGGKYTLEENIKQRVKQIVDEGADIIDVGAFSSRPGADEISVETEIKRLSPALKIIRELYPETCISVDTYRSEVVKFAVENFNVNIINDIYAGRADEKMMQVVAKYDLPYVMMHIQGTPSTMQKNPHYEDVVLDILKFFSERIQKAVQTGINDLIIDPGFGFGKTIDHNYELLARLDELVNVVEYPVLVGISRKSMIYKYLDITPQDALPGTISLNTIALLKGAKILRVHDVAETVQCLKVTQKLIEFL